MIARIIGAAAAIAALALIVTGCSSGEQEIHGTVVKEGQLIHDGITVSEAPGWWDDGTQGREGFRAIRFDIDDDGVDAVGGPLLCGSFGLEGKQVIVKDANGTTVAVGELGTGAADKVSGYGQAQQRGGGSEWDETTKIGGRCTFNFDLTFAPSSDFYSVSVADVPGEVQFTKDQILAGIELSL